MEDDIEIGGLEVSKRDKSEAISSALRVLASAATKMSARSRGIPSGEDFHFYHNFPEFKAPARNITAVVSSSLSSISDFRILWRNQQTRASYLSNDQDDALDWVVDVNDELLDRFGASMDKYQEGRTKEEEIAKEGSMEDDGFQLVRGKNKKKSAKESVPGPTYTATGVSVATKDKKMSSAAKPKVPFHIPSIRRPQDEYRIIVNNANIPFQHVWLEQNEDGSGLIHPLEKVASVDFIDRKGGIHEPVKPLSLEETPFKLVEELKDLREMCTKLKSVTEFAVDLEHNQYRSFQGLTCLMQISTRTEDFIVDTLKLRIYIGSYLREIFKDPNKRKVMHGADRDILWLQRDFGIYVVNLFDTGQASRVLRLERNSLEYLLHHFCNVEANKEYQNADWRLRPLPKEMIKYAREDTHYLLYIYDVMRNRLLSKSVDGYDYLLEVYNRSSEICLQMYEKELLTDTSFLNIYGVQDAELNATQLAIVAGLCHWRDYIARAEDESTGYILPNKILLEIAKEMPLTSDKLLQLVKSRHSVVERYIPAVLDIIRNSISNSSALEAIAVQLKQAQLEKARVAEIEANGGLISKVEPLTSRINLPAYEIPQLVLPVALVNTSANVNYSSTYNSNIPRGIEQAPLVNAYQGQKLDTASVHVSEPKISVTNIGSVNQHNISGGSTPAGTKVASVQTLKKPSAFEALFGKPSTSGKKPSGTGSLMQQEDAKTKVEKIKQAVALPFSFSGKEKQQPADITSHEVMMEAPPAFSYLSETPSTASSSQTESMQLEEPSRPMTNAASITMGDVILLEDGNSDSPSSSPSSPTKNSSTSSSSEEDENGKHEWFPQQAKTTAAGSNSEDEMPVSPTELSSSSEKCFKSLNEFKGSRLIQQKPNRENGTSFKVEPFDYAAARKETQFGEPKRKGAKDDDEEEGGSGGFRKPKKGGYGEKNNSKRSVSGKRGEEDGGFQHPRRRQAFPLTGNRSFTYT